MTPPLVQGPAGPRQDNGPGLPPAGPDGSWTRRAVLARGGVAAVAALAGCSQADSGGPGDSEAAGSSTLGSTADIPVGGGKVFADQKVVVTQPTAGSFQAFSAVCTHQGCTVQAVTDNVISCPCHSSQFKSTDGSVVQGPAQKALARRKIVVDGTSFKVD